MGPNPFGDIPLFREIQRLLASSSGPINMEIARQVAAATSLQAGVELPVDPDSHRVLGDAARASEVFLAGYSRLPYSEPATITLLTRAEWIERTLDEWKWLLDGLAKRFTAELGELGGEATEEQMGAALAQIGPLLLGLQTGALVGSLATEVLATFDPPIPRDGRTELFVVGANAQKFASEFELDATAVVKWLALNDVSRSLIERTVPWVDRYARNLLSTLVAEIEIDMAELERRLSELQSGGIDGLGGTSPFGGSIPIVESERHRSALRRVRAFMALNHGYATHIVDQVAGEILDDAARIEEGARRYNASASEGRAMLTTVLGFSIDRDLETAGRTFCEAIVKLEGIPALNRVWDAPDNLPTYDEIRDPFQWIERVVKADAATG